MKTAILSIKTDPLVKKQAQQLAADIGIPLGSLVNGLLKEAVRTQSVSFTARKERFPSEPMTPQMEKIIEAFEREGREGTLETVPHEAFMKELDDMIASGQEE